MRVFSLSSQFTAEVPSFDGRKTERGGENREGEEGRAFRAGWRPLFAGTLHVRPSWSPTTRTVPVPSYRKVEIVAKGLSARSEAILSKRPLHALSPLTRSVLSPDPSVTGRRD